MTEAELLEMSVAFQETMQGWVSAYFTGFTAYVITAYFVGKHLTVNQVVFVSGAFLIYSALCIVGALGTGHQTIYFSHAAEALNPDLALWGEYPLMHVAGVLLSIGVIGSLKFMWDVRHPKKE